MVAEGLLHDSAGEYRERLLSSQGEVLAGLSAGWEERARHRANRVNWPTNQGDGDPRPV